MANKNQVQQASSAPKSVEIDLINGSYNSADSAEIVCHLLDEKLKFLQIRNFSDQVRFGEQDEEINRRIEEIKKASQEAREFLKSDQSGKKKFKIESKITITLSK